MKYGDTITKTTNNLNKFNMGFHGLNPYVYIKTENDYTPKSKKGIWCIHARGLHGETIIFHMEQDKKPTYEEMKETMRDNSDWDSVQNLDECEDVLCFEIAIFSEYNNK